MGMPEMTRATKIRDDINKRKSGNYMIPEKWTPFEKVAPGVTRIRPGREGGIARYYCYDNALNEARKTGKNLYVGFIVRKPKGTRPAYTAAVHAWNMDEGEIYDKTLGSKEAANYYYYGKKVNPIRFKDDKALIKFVGNLIGPLDRGYQK